ncbi:MAG: hypothetical protein IPK15_20785 [Verrucomicrobia bacterium]|nr:hypothetical protein [Verrucomicrobiota bacterium]
MSGISVVFWTTELASACLVGDPGAFARVRVIVAEGRPLPSAARDSLCDAGVYHRLRHPATRDLLLLWADHGVPGDMAPKGPGGIELLPGWRLDLISASGEIAPFGSVGRARLTCERDGSQLMLDDYFRLQPSGRLQWRGNDIELGDGVILVSDFADLVEVACRHPAVWSATPAVGRETDGVMELRVHLRPGAVLAEEEYRVFLERSLYLLPARNRAARIARGSCSGRLKPDYHCVRWVRNRPGQPRPTERE